MARYTAIQDRSIVTLNTAKLHMRVDGNLEDSIIQIYLNAAKSRADAYCQNPFTLPDGVTELDIPADVEAWILMQTSKFYEARTLGVSSEQVQDLGKIQYDKHGGADAVDVDFALLKPWRRVVGFGGFLLG